MKNAGIPARRRQRLRTTLWTVPKVFPNLVSSRKIPCPTPRWSWVAICLTTRACRSIKAAPPPTRSRLHRVGRGAEGECPRFGRARQGPQTIWRQSQELAEVRRLAVDIKQAISQHSPLGFGFCPGLAERETGDPAGLYPAGRPGVIGGTACKGWKSWRTTAVPP